MPLFQVDIEKRLGSEFWTNVYLLNADVLGTAVTFGGSVATAERGFHSDLVSFTRYRVSSVAQGDGIYSIVPIGQNGQRSGVGVLPLFNTLRMDMTAQTGRPSRKFYRGVLGEGDINGEAVDTTPFVQGANDIAALFASTEDPFGLVDPQSQLFTGIVIHRFVQMRQLRRSTRRREQGGGIFP